MTAVNLKLRVGPSNTVEGPFALVGTSTDLKKLIASIEEAIEPDHSPDATFEVWIGSVQYGPSDIANELDKLVKRVRGEGPK